MPNENENEKEKIKTPNPDEKKEGTIESLTKALKELKEKSVSKEEFEKVVKEKEELTKAIIDGSGIFDNKSNKDSKEKKSLKELADSLLEDGISNLEYAKRSLDYREVFMETFSKDPFAPNNPNMTEADAMKAEQVAEVMKDCIEKANGSDSVFTALMRDRLNDDSALLTRKLKQKGYIN